MITLRSYTERFYALKITKKRLDSQYLNDIILIEA